MKDKVLLIVVGCILSWGQPSWAGVIINFDGLLDLKKNQLLLTLKPQDEGSVVVKAEKLVDDRYDFSMDFDHVKTPLFEFSSKVQSSLQKVQDASRMNRFIRGSIQSQYSLVNQKPIRELSGQFEVKDNRLNLTDISFGNIRCNGFVDLFFPHKLDLSFNLTSVAMPDFVNFWVRNSEYDSSGPVNGEIKISGDLVKPFLKGSLESYNGYVGKLEYDSIYLNIEGIYPEMKIAHSTVSQTNGMSFTFEGPFNLGGHDNFKKQIQALQISPLVSNTASSREWIIKRTKGDNAGATEIKYILRKSDQTSSPGKEDSGMLGVQKTVEF